MLSNSCEERPVSVQGRNEVTVGLTCREWKNCELRNFTSMSFGVSRLVVFSGRDMLPAGHKTRCPRFLLGSRWTGQIWDGVIVSRVLQGRTDELEATSTKTFRLCSRRSRPNDGLSAMQKKKLHAGHIYNLVVYRYGLQYRYWEVIYNLK